MRYVKMLGLAAVAAAALMAFVGASTASATVLCKTQGTGSPTGTTCPANQAYPAGTVIQASLSTGAHATLTEEAPESTVSTITCKKSTVEGKTSNEGSATETVKGAISTLSFTECTSPKTGGACTVTTIKPGSLEIHWIEGSHNGTLTATGQEVTTSCNSIFGAIHCIFTTNNTHVGQVTGGAPATLKAFEAVLSQVSTSFLCPEKAGWDGEYTITSPSPLFVAGHT